MSATISLKIQPMLCIKGKLNWLEGRIWPAGPLLKTPGLRKNIFTLTPTAMWVVIRAQWLLIMTYDIPGLSVSISFLDAQAGALKCTASRFNLVEKILEQILKRHAEMSVINDSLKFAPSTSHQWVKLSLICFGQSHYSPGALGPKYQIKLYTMISKRK